MMRRLALGLMALLIALFTIPTPAHADELRPGYVAFTQTSADQWTLVWRVPMQRGMTPATQPVLPKGCAMSGTPERRVERDALLTTVRVACTGPVAGQAIGVTGFAASQSDMLVRVAPLGRAVQALRLTAASPTAIIAERPGRGQVARTYFGIGVEHILFGYDHLLFVVALVLLLRGLWTVAKAVTAFTVAHSITLVGTTLGLVGLPQAPVEAVIALSILFLAVEIAKRRPGAPRLSERLPWLVAFLFGLLHGFGFAGALREVGLPEGEVPTALLTFNLGVEAGQIGIVIGAAALLAGLRRFAARAEAPALRFATYAIGGLSAYWLIERTVA
jgi:hydrogenase/urease accessory protein HupE